MRISPTQLEDWSRCPRYYRHRHINRDPEPPAGPALIAGRLLHRVLERYVLTAQADVLFWPTREKALADVAAERPRGHELSLEIAGEVPWERLRWLRYQPASVSTEVTLSVQIACHEVRGRADVVSVDGGAVHIVDWKTGRLTEHAERRLPDAPATLAYLALAKSNYAADHAEMHYVYVREGLERTVVASDDVIERLGDLVRAFVASDYEGTPGRHCDWCPWAAECPALREAALAPTPTDPGPDADVRDLVPVRHRAARAAARATSLRKALDARLLPLLQGDDAEVHDEQLGLLLAQRIEPAVSKFDKRVTVDQVAERLAEQLPGAFESAAEARAAVASPSWTLVREALRRSGLPTETWQDLLQQTVTPHVRVTEDKRSRRR